MVQQGLAGLARLKTPGLQRGNMTGEICGRALFSGHDQFSRIESGQLVADQAIDVLPLQKRGGKMVPVGTIIFDPEGEYFWPDNRNRPGLCDVPELEDKVVVFTRKQGPSPFYQSFVASDIKLDIRRLRPSDVISIALSADRQEQQNVRRLKQLNDSDWRTLVDETRRIYEVAHEPKELWLVEGAKHVDLFDYAGAEYKRKIISFLEKYL